jgi:peptide/nickel transport system permease protein
MASAIISVAPKGESYWDLVFRQYRRNRLAVVSLIFVLFLFVIAIAAPFLAGNLPLVLRGSFPALYHDRFEEWKLGGHPELIAALQNREQPAPIPQGGTRGERSDESPQTSDSGSQQLTERLATVQRQFEFLGAQLSDEQAQRLREYLSDYEAAVAAASSDDRAQIAIHLAALESNAEAISRQFDPAVVTLEEKLSFPVFAALTPVDFFFITLAILVPLLPWIRRMLPAASREVWRTAVLAVFVAATLLAVLRTGRQAVFDALDYKDQLARGGIAASLALFPPVAYGINEPHLEDKYLPPSGRYWMGTDGNGRDLLTRMIWGSRISLSVGFVAVAIYVVIGILVGTMAGYFRGWVDIVFSRLIEIVICFPAFFLILAVLAFLQPSIFNIMVVIGITGWTTEARLVRGEFLRLADQEFVLAAKGLGVSDWRIIFRHILPNGIAPVLVAASFGVASAILIESSLSFLGFGISIPVPSWGGILNEARENFRYWWITIFPGLAIFSTVTAYNLVGEGVRDAIDPRLKI